MSDTNAGERPHRIPEFAGTEEEGAFWDTRDSTDFEDVFHPVIVVFEDRSSGRSCKPTCVTAIAPPGDR